MKSFLVFLCVTLTIFAIAEGADECVYEGHTFQVGETYSIPGKCQALKCIGKGSFSGETCSTASAPPHCTYIPQDNSKPYPQCCPRFDC